MYGKLHLFHILDMSHQFSSLVLFLAARGGHLVALVWQFVILVEQKLFTCLLFQQVVALFLAKSNRGLSSVTGVCTTSTKFQTAHAASLTTEVLHIRENICIMIGETGLTRPHA